MSQNWLDKHHASVNILFEVEQTMIRLSDIHFIAGNEKISQQLFELADRVKKAMDLSRESTSENLNERIGFAQESSASLLTAILEGAIVQPKREGHE